jgi:short-subunit dehydrogenase
MGAIPEPTAGTAALVTGASSGIGAAIARELARRGHTVLLAARREDRLRDLAAEIESTHGTRALPMACDLADPEARRALPARIQELGIEVDVLVNNAGFGTAGPFVEQEVETEIAQLRILCEAVVDLTGRFAPLMAKRGRGAILTIASSSGFQPLPETAGYAAAKAWALTFSEALHQELRSAGVAVTAACPGPVKTEFFDVSGPHPVESVFPKFVHISAERCAKDSLRALDAGRRLVVPGPRPLRLFLHSSRWAPHPVLLPFLGRTFRAR